MSDTRELAQQAAGCFEVARRDDGGQFVRIKDGSPSWVQDVARAAHDDGAMLPDDWRYKVIAEACETIGEADEGADMDELAHEFADAVDVYSSDLLAWVGSHSLRAGYVDEAQKEGLITQDASLDERLMVGQYAERREVFGLVLDALAEVGA